jgi:peptidoglycan biosynthesis protein MviN/MurJ (putative lipid II flippase)
VNVALLVFALRKKLARLDLEPLQKTFLPLAIAGTAAALIAWEGWQVWEERLGHATIPLKIGAVFAPAIAAGLAYVVLALTFHIPAAQEMWGMVRSRLRRKK